MVGPSREGLQIIDVDASALQELAKFGAVVIHKLLLDGYRDAVSVGPQAIADPIYPGTPIVLCGS